LFAYVGYAQFDERLGPDPDHLVGTVSEFAGVSNLGVVNVDISCTTGCSTAGVYSIGGLAGITQGQMTNVFTTGKIYARYANSDNNRSSAGGLYGEFSGYAYNNYSAVDVTTVGFAYVGGFAGNGGAFYIGNSHASGSVVFDSLGRSSAAAGGFIGWTQGTGIVSSSASGNVTAKGGYVGGFAGDVEQGTVILSSSATGDVYLNDTAYPRLDYAGGFVGMIFDGSVAFSSSSGRVSSALGDPTTIGGFSGMVVSGLHGMSVGNYWNVETSGISTNGNGNYVPVDHDPGNTPIVDAYNAKYGTNLTPAQFHGGATGMSSGNFATLQQQSGNSTAVARSVESVANGGAPIATGPGTGTGSGNGGAAPGGLSFRPVRMPAGPSPDQFMAAMQATSASATLGVEATAAMDQSRSAAVQKETVSQAMDDVLQQVEQGVKTDDERHVRRRKAAIAAASRASGVTRGPSYRGTIRAIDVDGQRFELEHDSTPGGGNSGPPVSGGGQ
jgi:hypothetical protein